MPRYAVFAGSLYAARDWANDNRVPDSEWFYVDHAQAIRGHSPTSAVPVLAVGFWRRHDAHQMFTECMVAFQAPPSIMKLCDVDPHPDEKECRWCGGRILPVTMADCTAWVHVGVEKARWDRQSCAPGRRAIPAIEEEVPDAG